MKSRAPLEVRILILEVKKLCQIRNVDIQKLVAEKDERMMHCQRRDFQNVQIVMNFEWLIEFAPIAGILQGVSILQPSRLNNSAQS